MKPISKPSLSFEIQKKKTIPKHQSHFKQRTGKQEEGIDETNLGQKPSTTPTLKGAKSLMDLSQEKTGNII